MSVPQGLLKDCALACLFAQVFKICCIAAVNLFISLCTMRGTGYARLCHLPVFQDSPSIYVVILC